MQIDWKRAALVCAAVFVFSTGCAATPTGVPQGKLVGGGLAIDWSAPGPGTAILYDRANHQIITTRTLEPGERFIFPQDDMDEDILIAFYPDGIGKSKAQMELYFHPTPRP